MSLDVVPGKLFTVKKGVTSLVFDGNQRVEKFVPLKRGEVLLAISTPFERHFPSGEIQCITTNNRPYHFNFSPHNQEYILCTTKFLFEDKVIELSSMAYYIMQDYLAELAGTLLPLDSAEHLKRVKHV